jgi:hypothetical protein
MKYAIPYTMIVIIWYLLLTGQAQHTDYASVSGFVYDEETGEGIEAANVYISNTTFGDATDTKGEYIIPAVPPGLHELVVSVIGYEPQSRIINVLKDTELNFNFKLKPKIYESDVIEVIAADQKLWFRDLETFQKLFLGTSPLGKKCIIKNERVLRFQWPWETRLKASATEPLILINKGLGFRVSCVMIDFTWDKVREQWSWIIKPHFEELEPESEKEQKLWDENRREAYTGSLNHFLLSLLNDELYDNGYEIYISEKATYRTDPLEQYPADNQIVIKEGLVPGERVIEFEHYLKVINFNEFMSFNPARYQTSWLRLRRGQVTLDRYGYAQDFQPFEVYGYWATLGVADLLPRYFFTDKH